LFDFRQRVQAGCLAIEEGTYTLGWGAEVLARTAEALGQRVAERPAIGSTVKVWFLPAPNLEAAKACLVQRILSVRSREMVSHDG
jgi:hypothetical protein